MDVYLIKSTEQPRNVWLTQRIENINSSSISPSQNLANFLRLDQTRNNQSNLVIFEEFSRAARRTTELCSQ